MSFQGADTEQLLTDIRQMCAAIEADDDVTNRAYELVDLFRELDKAMMDGEPSPDDWLVGDRAPHPDMDYPE